MRGIFSAMLGSPRAAGPGTTPWAPDDDRWYQDGTSLGSMSNSGRRVTPDLSLNFSAVYAGINVLSQAVGSLPLRMYRREGEKTFEAPEHPLNDVIEFQPNRWQTAYDFRSMLMAHLVLRGNAYAEIIAGRRGFVDQLEPIHPDRVSVERLTDGTLRYRVQQDRGPAKVLLQDEILHVRSNFTTADGLRGIGAIAYARETIGLGLALEEHGARLFTNGARPSGVLEVPKGLDEPAYERLRAEWRGMFVGLANVHRTPILEDGIKFNPISLNAEDSQFLASREFQIEEIARWLNIPPVMLHHMTKQSSWGTGVEAIMLAFVRNNLRPWLKCWTDAIRRDLILAPQRFEAQFDIEELQRGDSRAQAEFYSRLVLNGILTRNEARAALGYNPLPDLDEPLVPTNTTTTDNMQVPTNKPEPAPGSAGMIGHNGGPMLDDAEIQG